MAELFHLPSLIEAVTDKKRLTVPFVRLFTNVFNLLNQGYPPAQNDINGQGQPQSATIPLAKITGGGAAGSLTFTNGILTNAVPPT